ncbi:MAG: hypothetical protein K2F65_00670, partial [Eubacterium sp.]|nr:hypothetical protein [Eubacterium sp.]
MKNRDLYKGAMSGVHHSDDAVERIYDMTVNKKNTNNCLLLKKIACFVFVFVLLIVGGEFGVNAFKNNKTNDSLTVMVAYASDNGKLSFGSKSEQKLFWGIYNAPLDDEKACKEAEARFDADKSELMKQRA